MTLGKASLLALALYLFIFPSFSILFNYAVGQLQVKQPTKDFAIIGNAIVSNTPEIRYNCSPATLGSSGWVTVDYSVKNYQGLLDFYVGFEDKDSKIKVSNLQEWAYYEHTDYKSVPFLNQADITVYNIASYKVLNRSDYSKYQNVIGQDIANNTKLISITGLLSTTNKTGTWIICYFASDPQVLPKSPKQLGFFYYFEDTRKEAYKYMAWDWRTLGSTKLLTSYAYADKALNWQFYSSFKYNYKNYNHTIRFYVDIPFPTEYQLREGGYNGEYYIALKPSAQTIQDAIATKTFYVIDPWWNSAWDYAIKLTCDNTGITENMTNYPVLVHLISARINWSLVQDDLDDLRFIDYDNSSTPLKAELEKYTTNTEAWIWVKLPYKRNYFFCYYSNPSATSLWDGVNVWNSDYKGVWHLSEATSATNQDSTSNNKDLTPFNDPTSISCYIDSGHSYASASSQSLYQADISYLSSINSFTLEMWINATNNSNLQSIIGKLTFGGATGQVEWGIYIDSGSVSFQVADSVVAKVVVSKAISANTGYYVTAIYDDANDIIYLYVNGGTPASAAYTGGALNRIDYFRIASRESAPAYYFDGMGDEARFSGVARSQNYTIITYRIVSDTYLTYGTPQQFLLNIVNKSISPSSYSVPIGTWFNLSAYVAETNVPDWRYVTNITLFLQPLEETFYLKAFNNSGTWQWSLTDTYNNGALNSSQCTMTAINASTVKASFNIMLYYNFTFSGINVNATSSTLSGNVYDKDVFHDAFTFNASGGGGSPAPTTLLMLIIAVVVGLCVIIYVVAVRKKW